MHDGKKYLNSQIQTSQLVKPLIGGEPYALKGARTVREGSVDTRFTVSIGFLRSSKKDILCSTSPRVPSKIFRKRKCFSNNNTNAYQ